MSTNEITKFEQFETMSEEEQNEFIKKAMDEEIQKSFYKKMRKKIDNYIKKHPKSKYINYLVAAPDFFYLLCKLLTDNRVPMINKAQIAAAILYFVSPLDILNDLIPGIGLVDDILIAVKVLKSLLDSVEEEVLKENWPGDGDVILQIKQLLELGDSVVGKNIWGKIKDFFKKK